MPKAAHKLSAEISRIANRYQVLETLGSGGMGAVYRVWDESTGNTIALKQLHKNTAQDKSEYVALFQHEYHTLAQLAHPLIIEVYDYGLDEQGPYYTMELLSGSDLKDMAPMEWHKACELLRDVAIALAILHSRRLVHRDISLRNVRITESGHAKLIDFGAMAPMGVIKKVVGTPPFIPPEAVTRQTTDGRSDLFSLGALAYYLLTRRYAYFSRKITGLIDAWRSRPMPPSNLVSGIPPALDNLVLSLLSLDKLARPINAAETIDRLNAIAGLAKAEPLELSQAYLSTPPLVGRDKFTTLFRKMMPNLIASRGGVVVVESASGIGRSRLLNAFVLEGKLAGALVISADSEDARKGDYGVVRTLLEDLLASAPTDFVGNVKQNASVLAHILPNLHERVEIPLQIKNDNPAQLRVQIQTVLQTLLTIYCRKYRLVIAVDDIHNCDEPSLAVLTAMSRSAYSLKLALAVTAETHHPATTSKAYRMIREAGTVIELEPLSREDIQKLIQSVFGNVPNTNIVVDWIYGTSRGNVRVTMELVQHLVDGGIARFREGNWILPNNLREQELPKSLEHALESRIQKLSTTAKALAESLALMTEYAPLRLEQYVHLTDEQNEQATFRAIDELVASQIITNVGSHYTFAQQGFIDAIKRRLDKRNLKEIHAKLATAYKTGNHNKPLVLIHHLQHCGEEKNALEQLTTSIREGKIHNEPYAMQVACCESSLRYTEAIGNAVMELFILRMHLLSLARRYDVSLLKYWEPVKEQLLKCSGMEFWQNTDPQHPSSDRVKHCMKMAQDRWVSLPECERVLNPSEAVQALIKCAFAVGGAVSPIFDVEILSEAIELIDPFSSTSPLLELYTRTLKIALHQVTGQSVYKKRLAIQEDHKNQCLVVGDELYDILVKFINPYYIALSDAANGKPIALDRAEGIEKDPRFAAHAWQVRLVAYLFRGNTQRAESCLREKELLAIQHPESDVHLLVGLIFEAWAYGMCGDLMGLKQILIPITERAEKHPTWVPLMLCVRGNYHFLRGELKQARHDLEKMLELAPIGNLFTWHRGIPVLVETLLEMGEVEEAYHLGWSSYEKAKTMSPPTRALRELSRILALSEAKQGNFQQAFRRIDETIESTVAEGVSGIALGILFEAGVWIALWAKDEEAFARYAEDTAKQYKPGHSPALHAKLQRLLEESQKHDMSTVSVLQEDSTIESTYSATMTATLATSIPPKIRDTLQQCQTLEHKAQEALSILLQHTEANEGYLYTIKNDELQLMAPINIPQRPGLKDQVAEYLHGFFNREEEETATMTIDVDAAIEKQRRVLISDDGYTFQPVILSRSDNGIVDVTGIAVLRIRAGTPFNPAWNIVSTIGECIAANKL